MGKWVYLSVSQFSLIFGTSCLLQMNSHKHTSSIIWSFKVAVIHLVKKAEVNKLIQYLLNPWYKEHPGASVLLPGEAVLPLRGWAGSSGVRLLTPVLLPPGCVIWSNLSQLPQLVLFHVPYAGSLATELNQMTLCSVRIHRAICDRCLDTNSLTIKRQWMTLGIPIPESGINPLTKKQGSN